MYKNIVYSQQELSKSLFSMTSQGNNHLLNSTPKSANI
jgi:hypothetical protein